MKKKSITWRYFIDLLDESKEKKAKCIFCDKVLSYRGGGPFILMRHIKAMHASLMNDNSYSKRKSTKTKDVTPKIDSNTDANNAVLYEESITDNVGTISTPALALEPVDKFEVCSTFDETDSIYYEESAASGTIPNSQWRNTSFSRTEEQNHKHPDVSHRVLSQQTFQEDEHEITGKRIGLQLKNLESEQRIFAEKLIADVIFYGQRKRLGDESCVKINTRSETNAFPMLITSQYEPSSSNSNRILSQ